MRNLFFLAITAVFSLAACKKDKPSPPVASPFQYEVSGIENLFVETTGTDSMKLSITRVLGTSQKVDLSLEGLPQNVVAQFSPANNGLPPFTPIIRLVANNAPEGKYTVTVKTNNSVAGEQKFEFQLTVSKPVPECIPSLIASYTGSELCESSPVPEYPASVERIGNSDTKVLLKNFGNFEPKIDVEVNVNCSAKRLTVAQQKIGTKTVSGSGTFDDKHLYIDYTVTDVGGITPFTVTCSAKYLRN